MKSLAAVTIGGRDWHIDAKPMTTAQEAFIHERALTTGLLSFNSKTENPDQFFHRIMERNRSKPLPLFEIFAAVHLPVNVPNAKWAAKLSKENAQFFVSLTNSTDVQVMTLGFMGIVTDAIQIALAASNGAPN